MGQREWTVVNIDNDKVRYLLIWFSTEPIQNHIVPIRRSIEDSVKEPREAVEIDVWLESLGGDAHAAYKLALILRNAASQVRVVIPDVAKSAATLLALVGDEIFLAPGSDLGPLDAQMPEEGSLMGVMSALNIARAADEVARDAVALAIRTGTDVLRVTGLSRAKTMETMLQFSASLSEPLVRQLDPRVVHEAKQLLRVTKQYAEKLLADTIGDHAPAIAQSLVEDFPTHGYVISIQDGVRLGLPVRPIAEYDLLDEVRQCHRAAEGGAPFVLFRSAQELLESEDEDTDENASDRAGGTEGDAGGEGRER